MTHYNTRTKKDPGSAILFDIQRFSLHDGPGTRTNIYFKGCPLTCTWCSNPESQKAYPQYYFIQDRCKKDCDLCVEACPDGALVKKAGRVSFDYGICNTCDRCVDACSDQAIKRIGKLYSLEDVVDIALRDIKIYRKSGGGVTFTGGEATAQPDFLNALNQILKRHNIHTCIETCGFFDLDRLYSTLEEIDLVLFDLKVLDKDKAIMTTGKDSSKILYNLKSLSKDLEKDIIIRIPLVPKITNDDKNLKAISDFIRGLGGKAIKAVELLPYHKLGVGKYGFLGRDYACDKIDIPSEKDIIDAKKYFNGYDVKVIE